MRLAALLLSAALLAPLASAATQRAVDPSKPLVLAESTTQNNASCDISQTPAATLLLPFFDVDINRPVDDASNTIFSVVNTGKTPQVARVTIWTDQGYPAVWFNIFLTGYGVVPVSLYDVLARGVFPQTSSASPIGSRSAANTANAKLVANDSCANAGAALNDSGLTSLQSLLTTGEQEGQSCRVGTLHAHATGYVTVDLVNSCSAISPLDARYYSQVLLFDNVLTGDWERIAPEKEHGNFAGGSPMVHIKAVPEGGSAATYTTELPYTFYDRFTPMTARRMDRRQPLPSSFAARWIQGGTGQFNTEMMIWREGATAASASCLATNAALPIASAVRFDENENPSVNAGTDAFFPVATSVPTTASVFPPMASAVGSISGWMFLNLDTHALITAAGAPRPSQNWVVVHLAAEGRYGVDYDATALSNGCAAPPADSIVVVTPKQESMR